MEVLRVGFLPVVPSAIRCVRFCPRPTAPRLAVARADGSIEMWCTVDGSTYFQNIRIPGRSDSPAESILWQKNDIVAAGFSGCLDLWDTTSLKLLHSLDCQGGPVWCIAANPVMPNQLAVGSEDGMVRLFLISNSGFEFSQSIYRQECRVLSVAWQSSGERIVIGGTNSTIRVINVSSGTCQSRISLDSYMEKTNAVWDLKCVGDTLVVSANATGNVQIWNLETGTLQQTFNQHSADVLTLAVRVDQEADIFACGVDSKIVKISRQLSSQREWIPTGHIRPHKHDVYSLHLSSTGMLASGGVEGELVITNAHIFGKSEYVKHQAFPCMAQRFKLASNGEILLWERLSGISVWRISQASDDTVRKCPSEQASPESVSSTCSDQFSPFCLLDLKNNPPHNILSSCISSDGSSIAVSNAYNVWVYTFDEFKCELSLIKKLPHPSHFMLFISNRQKLLLATTTEGLMEATFDESGHYTMNTILDNVIVKELVLSADGHYVGVLTSSWRILLLDIDCSVCVAKLPVFETLPVVMTLNASKNEIVVFVGGNCRSVYVYNIESRDLYCVGKVRSSKNEYFQGRAKLSHPLSILSIPFEQDLFSVYDNDCVMLFRLKVPDSTSVKAKKVLSAQQNILPVQLIKSASFVVFVGIFSSCTKQHGLVIVEKSQSSILHTLPPTFYRKRFGV